MIGAILIPVGRYRYCLRVDRASPWLAEDWSHPPQTWPYWGFVHCSCTRLDWDGHNVGGHPDPLHVLHVRRAARGVWRDAYGQEWGGGGLPMYYREREIGLFS